MDSIVENYKKHLAKLQSPLSVARTLSLLKFAAYEWYHDNKHSDRSAAQYLNISNEAIRLWKAKNKGESK